MTEANHPVVLFDGVCNFCNGSVNFLLAQDKKSLLRFAALQSTSGQQLLQKYSLPATNWGSFFLIANHQVYQKTDAVLKVTAYLPWYWRWTQLFWIVPRLVRNSIYNLIAKNRYKWFGKKESCMIPSAAVRQRFLD